MTSVSLKGIEKRFGAVDVIRGVDLTIDDGEFVVFVGPSGCGKSTLLRLISGLEYLSGGQLSIGGRVVNEVPASKRGVAMVFQSYALYPHLTVRQNMGFGLKVRKVPVPEHQKRVDEASATLKLEALLDRYPRELSGGQRQRVAIARALITNPRILIFDEATSALDYESERVIQENMRQISDGRTVLIIAHRLSTVRMADRIVTIERGRIVEDGTHDELIRTGGRYSKLLRLQGNLHEVS